MKALQGKRIVITRAEDQAGSLADALNEHGAEVFLFPCIAIAPPATPPDFDDVNSFDWLVLTSVNAARMFFQQAAAAGQDPRAWRRPHVAAVGPATADAIRRYGLEVDLVPETYVGEALFEALAAREDSLEKKRFLLPRGDLAREFLPKALRERGAEVVNPVVYQTVAPDVPGERLRELLAFEPDMVTFTSPSTARNFCAALGLERLEALKGAVAFASIGPVTTQALEEMGLAAAIEAHPHDMGGLVQAILEWAADTN